MLFYFPTFVVRKKKLCENTGVFVNLCFFFFSFLLQINWQQMCFV